MQSVVENLSEAEKRLLLSIIGALQPYYNMAAQDMIIHIQRHFFYQMLLDPESEEMGCDLSFISNSTPCLVLIDIRERGTGGELG